MAEQDTAAKVTEYDTRRGITITIPADTTASPATRRDARVTLTAENGDHLSLPLKHVEHLVQALEWMLKDERERGR